jgi:hypothetical protein
MNLNLWFRLMLALVPVYLQQLTSYFLLRF